MSLSHLQDYNDHQRSLDKGARLSVPDGAQSTICDALQAKAPGTLTFEVNAAYLSNGLTVSDEEVARAMVVAFEQFRLVLEPAGACTLAALLNRRLDFRNKTTVILATGGNVEMSRYLEITGRVWRARRRAVKWENYGI